MGRNGLKYRKLKIFGIAAGLAGVLFLAGCTKTAGQDGSKAGAAGTSETAGIQEAAGTQDTNRTDADSSFGDGEETRITGNGTTVAIEGTGAAADGANVTISSSGTYRLTGNITGGGVVVDAGKEDEVCLILDGVSITSADYSAIYASQSGLLTIVLEDRTENRVSDGNTYTYPQTGEDEPDAAIFSKDDVVFEGNGMLTVSGNYMNGIRGKDRLTINSGTYVIEAAEDGVKGKDAVEVNGGEITITAGSDGIQSNNNGEEDKGYVRITGGTTAITAGKKGILAETLVEVTGGIIDINAQDDGIHSGKNVRLFSGELTLSAGDDAVHSDNLVEVSGGTIIVEQSREGLEGLCVEITGGTIQINSEDDGINAARGTDTSGGPNAAGGSFGATEGAYIRITGGNVKINASGDGIDSNGDLYLEGGTVLAEGPAEGGNGALDYNGTGTISGGTILAVGSAGMFQTFSENSSQPMLMVYFDEMQDAGTTISIKDGLGNQLTETEISKPFEALLFSSPELKTGETYYIEAGEQDIQMAVDGILNQYGTPSSGGFRRIPGGGEGKLKERPGAGTGEENFGRTQEGREGENAEGSREGRRKMQPEAGNADNIGSESESEGTGNVSGKASVVVIQETLLAGNLPEESLPEGIHVLGSSGSME